VVILIPVPDTPVENLVAVAIPVTFKSLVVVRPVTPKVFIVAIPVTFRFAVSKLVEVRTPPTTITLLA